MTERNLPVYATSGCYYMFMSLVPVTMIICCILPYTPFNQAMVMNLIDTYFAESLGEILRTIANAVYRSNGATLTISIFLTLFSASASMKAVMKGIDAAYQCKKKNNAIIFTIRALVYMALLVVALIGSLVIMVYGGRILMLIRRKVDRVGFLGVILSKGRYFLVFLVLFLLFIIFYTLMPADRVKLKNQIPGAIFTSLIWVVFSWIFTIYVNISDKFGAYGFLGTVMVAMMWMYNCLHFLLIGGFLNSFMTERVYGKKTVETIAITENPEHLEMLEERIIEEEKSNPIEITNPENINIPEDITNPEDIIIPEDITNPEDIIIPEDITNPEDIALQVEENDKKSKKKKILLIIAITSVCAIAAVVAAFFVWGRKRDVTVPEIEIKD
ncbi:MAG: YihY/virulence factor BrkB family protein [Lachnospiraceae bacterium]|nr:YihY/virulence factor BrkB family protein [Lachnospiraceae bacterium]